MSRRDRLPTSTTRLDHLPDPLLASVPRPIPRAAPRKCPGDTALAQDMHNGCPKKPGLSGPGGGMPGMSPTFTVEATAGTLRLRASCGCACSEGGGLQAVRSRGRSRPHLAERGPQVTNIGPFVFVSVSQYRDESPNVDRLEWPPKAHGSARLPGRAGGGEIKRHSPRRPKAGPHRPMLAQRWDEFDQVRPLFGGCPEG